MFVVAPAELTGLFRVSSSGMELSLKTGVTWKLLGKFTGESKLNGALSFNRTFAANSNWGCAGSWTRAMRPDVTISMWPEEQSESEAEREHVMTHVHFDAKYRIDNINELFGKSVDRADEPSEPQKETYRHADLLKMHAYRDAIRRSDAAYVVYPGNVATQWRVFSEILPGLGAVCLRPHPIRESDGELFLTQLLMDLAEHVSNRESHRARARGMVDAIYAEK